jgi:hypothetical protein
LIKEKGAVKSKSFHPNVFFLIAIQYSDPQDELGLNDPKSSFDRVDITCVNGTGEKALHLALYEEK